MTQTSIAEKIKETRAMKWFCVERLRHSAGLGDEYAGELADAYEYIDELKRPIWFELPVMPYRHKRYLVSDGGEVRSVAYWDGKTFALLEGCGIKKVKKWMEIPE